MEDYGIFKKLSEENHYSAFTKSVNSVLISDRAQKSLRRITLPTIRYAHMGQLVEKDGIFYATFIQNTGNDGEQHHSTTSGVVLAIFSADRVHADDFSPEKDVQYRPIGGLGTTFAGRTAVSIFKDNSMCLAGDKIYICFTFTTEDEITRMFRVVYDIPKDKFCEETELKLSYRGQIYDFTDRTINIVYQDKGLEPRAEGLIELVSAWSEYEGEYYATGVTIEKPNNGFVVKTGDFVTMELVDVPAFNEQGTAEIASIVFEDRLFVACRQDYGVPYLLFNYYDLKKQVWGTPYRIEDGNSRPWFFIFRKALYLMNTVQEVHRRYTNISRVRVLHTGHGMLDDKTPIETLFTLADCGFYFATCNLGDKIAFVSTKDTESYGEFDMQLLSEQEVNGRLVSLFSK